MLFNFLKKKTDNKINEELIDASVTYYIKRDSKSPVLNIEINNYDDQSIEALCKLLDLLNSESCYIETVEMIKNSLINDKREDILIKILTHVEQSITNKLLKAYEKKAKEEPCIKPSDMIK